MSERLKEAYQRLELLDERLTHRVRPRSHSSMVTPGLDQLDTKLRDLAEYTIELKEILNEFMLAFARDPKKR